MPILGTRARAVVERLIIATAAAVLLVLAPSWLLMGEAIWKIALRHAALVLGPAVAYLAAAVGLALAGSNAPFRKAVFSLAVFLSLLAFYYLTYLLIAPGPRIAGELAVVAFGLSLSFVALNAVPSRKTQLAATGIVGAIILIVGFATRDAPLPSDVTTRSIATAYGPIRVDTYHHTATPKACTSIGRAGSG